MDRWGKGTDASRELSGKDQFRSSSYLEKEAIGPVRNTIMMYPDLKK